MAFRLTDAPVGLAELAESRLGSQCQSPPAGLELQPGVYLAPEPLCASRAWIRGTPGCTSFPPPGLPWYAFQKATPLQERAAAGPLRNPGEHSGSPGHDPSLEPDSDRTHLNSASCRPGGPDQVLWRQIPTHGPGRKPVRGPGLRMGRGGAGERRAMWEASAHITGPIRGTVAGRVRKGAG